MSAIAGLFHQSGQPVYVDMLAPAMTHLKAYGGDHEAIWSQAQIGLAQHIKRTHAGRAYDSKPYTENQLTIVADLRLDNRDKLISALSISQHEGKHLSDTALILRAYQKWSVDCPAHLLGDFAFAIWDEANQHLFCGRDFIGVRPFYYYHYQGIFAFASDIQALFQIIGVKTGIDEAQVFRALLGQGPEEYYNPRQTYYQHIYRLPYAHHMIVTPDDLRLQQYWTPPPVGSLQLASDTAYIEQTRALLFDAVQCRASTDLAIGAHLSGGLDSSSLAIVAARHRHGENQPMRVYSWSPPAGHNPDKSSEQYRIETICEQEELTCQYIPYTPVLEDSNRFASGQQARGEHGVMQQAQRDGVHLMLSGWGGDEFITFNGRGIRSDLFLSGKWISFLKTFQWRPFSRERMGDFFFKLWRDVGLVVLPISIYRRWHPGHHLTLIDFDDRCLDQDFVWRLHAAESRLPFQRYEGRGRWQNQVRLFNGGHVTDRMEQWAQSGAQYGIQYTYPLLDKRLVELAFAAPDSVYVHNGQGRNLFYRAVRDLFPLAIRDQIIDKSEPAKQAHQRVITQFMLSRWDARYDAPLLASEIPHVKMSCLQDVLANHVAYEDRKPLRAWQLARLWHTLQDSLHNANQTIR